MSPRMKHRPAPRPAAIGPLLGRGAWTARLGLAALAAALCPAAVAAQIRTPETVLMPEDPRAREAQERYGYSQAVIAGDMIYLSGIVAGLAPGETDLKAAYRRAYQAILAILARAGAGPGDVVDVTSYHTDVVAQIDALADVQKQFLGSPPPAWTAIDVDRLLPDGGLTEIKIVARRSRPAPKAGQD